MELDLYLVDGTVVEIWTKDPQVVKAALPYMTTPDLRAEYRKMRRHYWTAPTEPVVDAETAELNELRNSDSISAEQYQRLMKKYGNDPTKWKF